MIELEYLTHQNLNAVRLINDQVFDRVQAKYLRARDVAALREYANVFLDTVLKNKEKYYVKK